MASIGKKRVSKTDIATGQVVEEMHLVAELEQRRPSSSSLPRWGCKGGMAYGNFKGPRAGAVRVQPVGLYRNNGKGWHGGSDEEGLDSTITIRCPIIRAKSISGRVVTARKVDRSTGSKTWEWGWYVCVELDAGQTPDAVNCLYFCHNARNLVSVGQRVKSGDALAVMGTTGNAALASPPFCTLPFRGAGHSRRGQGLTQRHTPALPNAVGTYGEALNGNGGQQYEIFEGTFPKMRGVFVRRYQCH